MAKFVCDNILNVHQGRGEIGVAPFEIVIQLDVGLDDFALAWRISEDSRPVMWLDGTGEGEEVSKIGCVAAG
jgi:hypothetical protein